MVKDTNNEAEGQKEEVKIAPYPYDPDYAVHPGLTLSECIAGKWAEDNGLEVIEICDIINGFKPITPELAKKFEKLLGIPETFWNNLQRNYETQLEKIKNGKLA
tara:strand:+ start:116 stop:427 length:312 start_codon:yes stop_codon:yes gene_type:complete